MDPKSDRFESWEGLCHRPVKIGVYIDPDFYRTVALLFSRHRHRNRDVEETVEKTGKKVIVRGCSGGTINGYAFLMSQTEAWRKRHVMAFVAVAPVFGGTVSSLHSVLAGWKKAQMDRCAGRAAAELLPSVLWMWPRKGLWNRTETLVITKTKNYTAYDLDRMLLDMRLPKTSRRCSTSRPPTTSGRSRRRWSTPTSSTATG